MTLEQIELRILANKDAVNVDLHKETASEVFKVPVSEVTEETRRAAKAINFAIMYNPGKA